MGRLTDQDTALRSAAQRWIVRLTSGNMSEREMRRFRHWMKTPEHERIFDREMANWRRLGELRSALSGSITLPSGREVARRRLARGTGMMAAASAAVLSMLLAGPNLLLHARADHIAGTSIARIDLPDGSRAVLDAGAAISEHFGDGERRVDLLRGRAWFEVAHKSGPTFEVAASGGMVEDIGTAFEVARDGSHVETAVSQGIVRVRGPSAEDPSLVLRAGERASFDAREGVRRERDVPVQRVAAWRSGDIVLEGVSVRQAVAQVARYRRGPTWVWGPLQQAEPITVVLRSDRPEAALDALAASAGLSLLHLPGGIVIIRQNSSSS